MINYYTRSLIGQRIDRFETTKKCKKVWMYDIHRKSGKAGSKTTIKVISEFNEQKNWYTWVATRLKTFTQVNPIIKPRINNDQLSNSLSHLVIYVHVLSLRNIPMRLNTCSMIETAI